MIFNACEPRVYVLEGGPGTCEETPEYLAGHFKRMAAMSLSQSPVRQTCEQGTIEDNAMSKGVEVVVCLRTVCFPYAHPVLDLFSICK